MDKTVTDLIRLADDDINAKLRLGRELMRAGMLFAENRFKSIVVRALDPRSSSKSKKYLKIAWGIRVMRIDLSVWIHEFGSFGIYVTSFWKKKDALSSSGENSNWTPCFLASDVADPHLNTESIDHTPTKWLSPDLQDIIYEHAPRMEYLCRWQGAVVQPENLNGRFHGEHEELSGPPQEIGLHPEYFNPQPWDVISNLTSGELLDYSEINYWLDKYKQTVRLGILPNDFIHPINTPPEEVFDWLQDRKSLVQQLFYADMYLSGFGIL